MGVKYIDPSYMIRSVPANATDTLYCMQLGQNAVHACMAGLTGFSVGLCNNKLCYLPIPELVATSPRQMNPQGRTWERILAVTRQPNAVPRPARPEEERVHATVRAFGGGAARLTGRAVQRRASLPLAAFSAATPLLTTTQTCSNLT